MLTIHLGFRIALGGGPPERAQAGISRNRMVLPSIRTLGPKYHNLNNLLDLNFKYLGTWTLKVNRNCPSSPVNGPRGIPAPGPLQNM